MGSLVRRISTVLHAISHVPPRALVGHAKRRYRNKTVPLRPVAYRVAIESAAGAFTGFAPSEPAMRAAGTVALFQGAKQAKNVPGCLAGRFTFLNRTIDFGSVERIDWRVTGDEGNHQLWRANLAYLGYVCAAMDAAPAEGLSFAARLIPSFLREADFSRSSDFSETWHPYAASQRLLSLTAALLRAPAALRREPDWAAVEAFVRLNAAFLLENLETELGYNHLERNLSALALFALSRERFPQAISAALQRNFDAILEVSIGADGVQKERSAMYQALSVQSLRIFHELPVWSDDQRRLVSSRLAAAEDALAALTLGDDQPVMFNDGWMGEGPATSLILPNRPATGFHAMCEGGYVRLADGPVALVFDAGPIGADMNPGHGHADFLAVEASVGSHRLIVDPGTFSYSSGALRDEMRAWQSHNGPCIAECEPVTFLGSFKVGRRHAARLVAAEFGEDGVQSASGILSFANVSVERTVNLRPGGEIEIADRWASAKTGARSSRFLVPSEWSVEAGDPQQGGCVLRQDGWRVSVTVENGTLTVEPGRWSRRYNIWETAQALTVAPLADAGGCVTRLRIARDPR